MPLFDRGSLSKELQASLDRMMDQLKHLVEHMNVEYEQQLGQEQQAASVMGKLNEHHQLIQRLEQTSREMERDIAELEVSHRF